MANLPQDLAAMGIDAGYRKYVVELEPILQQMSARGVPVDPDKYAAFSAKLHEMLVDTDKAIQELIPDEVRACRPMSGYKRAPVGVVEGESTTAGKDKNGKPVAAVWGVRRFPVEKMPGVFEMRFVKLLPWKPSHDGLIRFMKHMHHPIPANHKTGKPTTEEIELGRLARKTKHPLYSVVQTQRQIGTILNNHIKNWAPGEDGRVHPTFYYDPGTGQLSSRRPNAQNAPRHGEDFKKELADEFRSMVAARPGHTLIEFDYKSFHAQTLAFEAGDADYLRLAKLDIHSFLTAHLVKTPDRYHLLGLSDEELRRRLGEIRQAHSFVRDYKAKKAILGYGFGMGWKKMYMMNKESFDSQADAKATMDMLNGLFPRACRWRDDIRKSAHEQGYLLSRSGCLRWFWEVFRWRNGGWVPGGDDSEAAVAFLPANDAFCHIKDAMRRLHEDGWLRELRLINQVHDSLLFECPDLMLEEALAVVPEQMERPSLTLVNEICPTGLSVEVDIKAGPDWANMKGVKR